MSRRVCLTGAAGFVGSSVLATMLERGLDVSALVNERPVGGGNSTGGRVRSIPGGLFDWAAVDRAIEGCEAVVHVVGIIAERPRRGITFARMHFDATRAMLEGARRAGVKRFVQMSALGTRPNAASRYHQTKWEAEELVRSSGLDWTIFRPALVHGPRGEFMKMEAAWARGQAPPFLFMPYFAGGLFGLGRSGKIQPVYVQDVSRAFADALDKPASVGQTYELVGPDVMSWPQMHRMCARIFTGRQRATAAIPAWFARLLAAVMPAGLLPFNRDQVIMALEDNTGDGAPLIKDFGWSPAAMETTVREYARRIGG